MQKREHRHDAARPDRQTQRSPDRTAKPLEVASRGLASAPSSIDAGLRDRFEQGFSHRFDHIRVHHDAEAARAADSLDAAAYTVGSEIAFGAGYYAPHTPWGQALLAHELAHVVQNDALGRESDVSDERVVSREGDPAEREAATAARAAMAGELAPAPVSPAPAVARFALDALWNTITDNTLSGTVGYATEASKDASSWFSGAAGEASGIPWLGRALGPLGIISNLSMMDQALETGGIQGGANFTAGGMGVVGSLAPTLELLGAGAGALGFGTTAGAGAAGTGAAGALGGAASALGPISAVAGSAAGGYALGSHMVGASDRISREQGYFEDDFGNAQSGSSEAADWGVSVDEWFGHDNWLLDKMGGVAGGATAMGGGIANTAYGLGRRGVEKVGDAVDYIGENTTLDPDEIDWGRTFSPWNW